MLRRNHFSRSNNNDVNQWETKVALKFLIHCKSIEDIKSMACNYSILFFFLFSHNYHEYFQCSVADKIDIVEGKSRADGITPVVTTHGYDPS